MDGYVEGFARPCASTLGPERAVVVYASGARTKPQELPARSLRADDGHFEYSAVATTELTVSALWHFMLAAGPHEKTLAELKSQVGFEAIRPMNRYAKRRLQL